MKNCIYKNKTNETPVENNGCKPNYFLVCINVGPNKNGIVWDYFTEMGMEIKKADRVETFKHHPLMKQGDYVLLYITKKGLQSTNRTPDEVLKRTGVHAIGRVLSAHPFEMKNIDDRNFGEVVVKVSIDFYNLENKMSFPNYIKPNSGAEVQIINSNNKKFQDSLKKEMENAEFKPIL